MPAYPHVPFTTLVLTLSLCGGVLPANAKPTPAPKLPAKTPRTPGANRGAASLTNYLDWVRQTERKRAVVGASIASAKNHRRSSRR